MSKNQNCRSISNYVQCRVYVDQLERHNLRLLNNNPIKSANTEKIIGLRDEIESFEEYFLTSYSNRHLEAHIEMDNLFWLHGLLVVTK